MQCVTTGSRTCHAHLSCVFVLVFRSDGASQSGLYAAISCIWEKMKLEQEVDIFHSVKHLRYHRPQVVQNLVSNSVFPRSVTRACVRRRGVTVSLL